MKIPIRYDEYIKGIDINNDSVDVTFLKKKKVALLFISINPNYWPYLEQVIKDCRQNFLPHHNVDYFVWSDMPEGTIPNVHLTSVEPIEWPAPTLMRYHLFLQEEERLKDYDYIFYLDADMRVVEKISDEILGKDLTVALHPMYDLKPQLLPPYEPNQDSTAFVPRLGHLVDAQAWADGEIRGGTAQSILDSGRKPRLRPLYLAGGFQGGNATSFLEAMRVMKKNIDIDFNKNYVAIWNDESHWNKYLFEHKGPILSPDIIVLGADYVYPDSLIKEYYEPIWGKSYKPKIITLTKPFTTSKQSGKELQKMLNQPTTESGNQFQCPTCKDVLEYPNHRIKRVVTCQGSKKPHELEMTKL